MAKAVKGAFKWVSKIALGAAGFLIKPVLRALTPPAPEVDHSQTLNFRADPNAGVPYVIGRTGTAGTYIYATVGEPKNRNMLFYTILSGGGPIDSFVSFSMNKTPVVFDGADTPESGPYRHLVWQRRQLGTTPQTYLQPPNTTDAAVLSEWDSTHATSGYAAAWYVLGADQNAYSNGVPDPLWVLKGVRCYDWRQDSTYPGGSGSQRLATPSTWGWTENPAVHAVAWILGRYANGKRVLGLGGTLSQIVMAKYTEWANVCDANGWNVGGVVYSTDTKWQVLKAICQAGGAYPTPLGAKISVIFNAPRVSIATLTGADMEAEPTIVGSRSRRDRFNAAVPRFRSEANGWQIVPAAPLVVSSYVTADGGQRTKELEWPLVQDVDQATQLAAYAICNSRELGPLDFSLIPSWLGLEPGDCITINEPEYGLTSQKVVIVARNRAMSSFERSVSCVTETDSKHAFCLGQTGVAPPAPSLSSVDTLPTPPDVADWVVTIGSITGPGGTLPAIVIDGVCNDPNAIEIIVEYRLSGSSDPWTSTSWPVTTTHIEIVVAPGVTYDVQIRYRYARNTEDVNGNTDLGVVTTPPIDAGTFGGLTGAEITADIAAAQAAADAAYDALFDPTSGAIVQIEALQDQDATFVSQIAVLTTGQTTAAGRITTLEAHGRQGAPNLLLNSDFSDGMRYWTPAATAGAWVAYRHDTLGNLMKTPAVSGAQLYQDVPVSPGSQYVLSAEGDGGSNGYMVVAFLGTPVVYSANMSATGFSNRASLVVTIPSGYTTARVIFVTSTSTVHSWGRIQFQTGAAATDWRNDVAQGNTTARVTQAEIAQASTDAALASFETTATASISGLSATVTTQGTAIASVQGRTASYLTKVAAAGADPAYIYMQSDSTAAGGADSYIALASKSINLFNTAGGGTLVTALALTGGNAYFPGSVFVGATGSLQLRGDLNCILVVDPAAPSVVRAKFGKLT